MLKLLLLAALFCGLCSAGSNIVLENFTTPSHHWVENNDPVMGGQSTGTTTVGKNLLVFNGSVVDVPALKAPGFITTQTSDKTSWADVSGCKSLAMDLKSNTEYTGYRVSFGKTHAWICGKIFAYGYKSHFDAPPVGQFGTVVIPFGNFSDCWDDATGKIIHSCADNSKFCPSKTALQNLETVSIWGEGVGGDVHLEVQSIYGTDCN